MTNSGRPTKNEKRDHAREQARVFREKQQAQQRRRRRLWQAGVSVVIIAVIAVVAVVIINQNHNANVKAATQSKTGPKNMISDGILLSGSNGKITAVTSSAVAAKGKPTATNISTYTGKANIREYIDFQCPYCNQFETTNLDNINKWVAAGKATVEIHPISFLDANSSGNRYSSRAANASACVAQYAPNNFLAVVKTLYKNQPAEGGTGMSNDKLISLLGGAGASSDNITACIKGEQFKTWVTAATARANIDVFGGTVDNSKISTPTVFVNNQQWSPTTATSLTNAAEFSAFVDQVVPGTTS
ncbi:MAG: hypothetical protein JWQ39_2308 [Glaciihabitans sp.]|jgi:protein-disulfide isomerase|nr:hypothetical protein [Glaciihabitans sp.]